LDAALTLMGVPDAVIEAKLNLLLDVAGKIIGGDPAGVDVEGGLAPVGVCIDEVQLHRVPGRAIRWPDQAALAGGTHARKLPVGAEREVDQFEVVNGHVGPRIAAGDPLGKLTAA